MEPKAGFWKYLWVCFVAVVRVGTTMVYAAEKKTLINVNVGVILDLSSRVGKMGLSCIDMSLSDFYASYPHHTTAIVLHVNDSKADVVRAATQAIDLIQNSEVEAILGAESSSQARFIIQLGDKAEVPIISFAAASSTLSYLRSPYFFRVAQNDSYQIYAISAVVQTFEWRQVVAIYQDDEFGKCFLADLIEALPGICVHRSVMDRTASGDQIKGELHRLKMMQTRVFIVHMVHSLATQVFAKADEIRMMSEGYVWILTDATANVLNTMNASILNSMQGVVGVKTHVPRTLELDNFTIRWRKKFRQDNPDIDDPKLDVYGLWAYDAAWALATVFERLATDPNFTTNKLMKSKTSGVSQNGKKIRESLSTTKFTGLSGEFNLVKGQLKSPNLQIVNVIGEGERTVGYWTPEKGLTRDFKRKGTRSVIWPGDSFTVPKGWDTSFNGEKKLKIGVPVNVGFSEFARVMKNGSVVGYCIDIFDAVVAELRYSLPHEYIPFTYTFGNLSSTSYDDLVMQVSEGKFDAAVGDLTILANRSSHVDFTLPFTEAGISVIIPVRHNLRKHEWVFLKPLTLDLWITSFCFFIFISFVVWILEHQINDDFRGPPSSQIGTSLWFSFCTMVFAQREALVSNLARFVVVIWFFVVFILTQSYTASLTSWLTVQQLQPATDINQIIKHNWRVGYQGGSYVFDILQFLGIKDLVPYNSIEQLHELFTRGSCNGGIDAAIDEIPYMKLLLSRYSEDYTMADSLYKSNGFGFAFPIGSPLVDDISKAVLNVTESDKLNKIQEKWFGNKISHQSCKMSSMEASSSSLDLSYFWSLFIIAASAAIFALILYFFRFLHSHRLSLWRRMVATFHIFRMKEEDRREGGIGINAQPSAAVAVEEDDSPSINAPSPSNDSIHSLDPSFEHFNEFGDSIHENKESLHIIHG